MILEFAFRYSNTPDFRLAHGGYSKFYFNCKRVTLDPEGQYLIGNLVFETIRQSKVVAVGGPSFGADPISTAVAYTSWLKGYPLQAFAVRREKKDHGITALIEGKIKAGDRVAIVDDVITTGSSTIQAIRACRRAGLEVVHVVAVVDRQEFNGRENILKEVPRFDALVTRNEIMGLWKGLER